MPCRLHGCFLITPSPAPLTCTIITHPACLLRVVLKFFQHCAAPHTYVQASGSSSSSSSHSELAFASLRLLQLLPDLSRLWGAATFFCLLHHEVGLIDSFPCTTWWVGLGHSSSRYL